MNWKQTSMVQQLAPGRQLESSLPSMVSSSGCGLAQPSWAKLAPSLREDPGQNFGAVAKRLYDLLFSGIGLLLLSPLLVLLAILIKLADGGAVFYRQTRIGQFGVPFLIYKFRTMVPNADQIGPSVTGDGDRRITRLGRFLRRTKLDELPQLWNVFRGEMSLVGPRPEVPRYVAHYTPEQRTILESKPGITDLASLCFRNEEALLNAAQDTERFYVEQCLPRKLKLNQEYARRANLLTDTWIILQTICPYWAGVLALYGIVLTLSFWLSQSLLRNFELSASAWHQFTWQAPIAVAAQLGCLLARRHCKGLLCYFGMPELRQIGVGLGLAAFLMMGLSLVSSTVSPPCNLILIDLCTSVLLLSGFRLLLRLWRERAEGAARESNDPPMRVGIIGTGSLGAQLARYLNGERRLGRTAVAFFDDDFSKWQKQIHQVPVVGMPECLLQGWGEKLDEVAIALPSASPQRLQELSQLFEKVNLRVYNVTWLTAGWPSNVSPASRNSEKPPVPDV